MPGTIRSPHATVTVPRRSSSLNSTSHTSREQSDINIEDAPVKAHPLVTELFEHNLALISDLIEKEVGPKQPIKINGSDLTSGEVVELLRRQKSRCRKQILDQRVGSVGDHSSVLSIPILTSL